MLNAASQWTRTALPALAIAIGVALTGCGNGEDTMAEDADEQQDAHLLEAQEQALERARAVEDQVLEAAEQQREAIDEQTGDG